MSKEININELEKEHSSLYPVCEEFCQEVVRQLLHLTSENKIKLAVPIQFRAKTWQSVSDKITQKRFTVKKSIAEIQDLSGIRIILLFTRDTIKIKELIYEHFKVEKEYNTEEKLKEDQFGYSSTHIIAKLKDEWLKTPSLSKFKQMTMEFQIRTLSQHSWAEVSNILQYKQEDNVPKPLKRSISRISALLETVDLEYERMLSDREQYKTTIENQNLEVDEIELNVDLLEQILDTHLPEKNKEPDDDYSDLLMELQMLEFNTTSKVIKLITNNLDKIIALDKKISAEILHNYNTQKELSTTGYIAKSAKKIKSGAFFAHSGLIRAMLSEVLGKSYRDVIDVELPEKID